jgi:hypothetical protein
MNIYPKFFYFTSLLYLIFALNANSAEQSQKCEFLGEHLYSCEKFSCETFSSKNPANVISQEIKGKNDEGLCVHEQIMSNGERVVCEYEEQSRKFMSIKMADAKSGNNINKNDDVKYSEALVEQIFLSECVVYDREGNIVKDKNAGEEEYVDFLNEAKTKNDLTRITK